MTTDRQNEARERLADMARSIGIRLVDDVGTPCDPTIPAGADPATWDRLQKPRAQYD